MSGYNGELKCSSKTSNPRCGLVTSVYSTLSWHNSLSGTFSQITKPISIISESISWITKQVRHRKPEERLALVSIIRKAYYGQFSIWALGNLNLVIEFGKKSAGMGLGDAISHLAIIRVKCFNMYPVSHGCLQRRRHIAADVYVPKNIRDLVQVSPTQWSNSIQHSILLSNAVIFPRLFYWLKLWHREWKRTSFQGFLLALVMYFVLWIRQFRFRCRSASSERTKSMGT